MEPPSTSPPAPDPAVPDPELPLPETPEQLLDRCKADFVFFCDEFVFIDDKKTHTAIRFDMYKCQRGVAADLCAGRWLWILKARQLGITWLLAAYAVWLVTFHDHRTIAVLNQDKDYAEDFIDRVRFIFSRMPPEMKQPLGDDNKQCMEFLGTGSVIRAIAASQKAARSMSADLIVFDEAAFIEAVRAGLLEAARMAAAPTLEQGKGQMVCISTSLGPRGDFYATFQEAAAGKSRFKSIFFPWDEHPNRTPEWYAKEAADNIANPLYMKREYPATPEEAFESSEGRIYPLFVDDRKTLKTFIREIPFGTEIKPARFFRAIDWGGKNPFVCLWGAIIPGDGDGLTIDPGCTNTIKEMLAYSWEKGKPADHDNHACDALRYMIITPGLNGIKGHLHIYRELYEPDSASRGFGIDDLARKIIALTGEEKIELTIADCTRGDNIRTYHNLGVTPIQGQRKLSCTNSSGLLEIEQGIVQVNTLIVAWAKNKKVGIPAEQYSKWFDPFAKSKAVQQRPPVFG